MPDPTESQRLLAQVQTELKDRRADFSSETAMAEAFGYKSRSTLVHIRTHAKTISKSLGAYLLKLCETVPGDVVTAATNKAKDRTRAEKNATK